MPSYTFKPTVSFNPTYNRRLAELEQHFEVQVESVPDVGDVEVQLQSVAKEVKVELRSNSLMENVCANDSDCWQIYALLVSSLVVVAVLCGLVVFRLIGLYSKYSQKLITQEQLLQQDKQEQSAKQNTVSQKVLLNSSSNNTSMKSQHSTKTGAQNEKVEKTQSIDEELATPRVTVVAELIEL